MMKITAFGGEEAANRLIYFVREFPDVVAGELYIEMSSIMKESKKQVPVDTGTLRASGFVEKPVNDGGVIRSSMGYGGYATKINKKTGKSTRTYAVYVHESTTAKHKVGNAKFLERPVMARRATLVQNLNSRIKRFLERAKMI